jgi:hypothetical protein
MCDSNKTKEDDKNLIVGLVHLGAHRIDIWRYFSERADKLVAQLWTIGAWLLGIISAVLALPFIAKFLEPDSTNIILVKSRFLASVISLAGLLLCGYAYIVLKDI